MLVAGGVTLSNRLYAPKNPLALGTKRGIAQLRDVDVGWERLEPKEQVKYLLPSLGYATHMKLEKDGTAARFRLTN